MRCLIIMLKETIKLAQIFHMRIRDLEHIFLQIIHKRNKLNFGMTGLEIKLPETRLTFQETFKTIYPF